MQQTFEEKMSKPNKNCTIYWLTRWQYLTPTESDALYIAAEALDSHYNRTTFNPQTLKNPRKKWYEKSRSNTLEHNTIVEELIHHLNPPVFHSLFNQIILGNNMPLLHALKKNPQALYRFQEGLQDLCAVIMARIETSHSTS
jgi:hypothetical protein